MLQHWPSFFEVIVIPAGVFDIKLFDFQAKNPRISISLDLVANSWVTKTTPKSRVHELRLFKAKNS